MRARILKPVESPPQAPTEDIRATLGLDGRRRRQRIVRWSAGVVIAGAVIAALVVWQQRRGEVKFEWETVAVSRGDIAVSVDATGTLEPEHSVTIGAEVSGKIASVEVDEDDRVELGQVLARFDLETFETELAEAKASLAASKADVRRARASLRASERALARVAKLSKSGVASDEELEQSESGQELAAAELGRAAAQQKLAEARIDQIHNKIAKAEVHAPIAGVVLTRSVEPGTTLAASFQAPELFVIAADLSRMTLELAIDEADVGRIRGGEAASFRVDAWPERDFEARVTKVHLAPRVAGTVVTYVAELAVANDEGLLRPGMTATATIAIGIERDVLRIPTAALRFSPPDPDSGGFHFGPPATPQHHASGSAVWVLRDGAPTRVAIEAGASDGEWIAVVGGELEVDDEVLVGAEANER